MFRVHLPIKHRERTIYGTWYIKRPIKLFSHECILKSGEIKENLIIMSIHQSIKPKTRLVYTLFILKQNNMYIIFVEDGLSKVIWISPRENIILFQLPLLCVHWHLPWASLFPSYIYCSKTYPFLTFIFLSHSYFFSYIVLQTLNIGNHEMGLARWKLTMQAQQPKLNSWKVEGETWLSTKLSINLHRHILAHT